MLRLVSDEMGIDAEICCCNLSITNSKTVKTMLKIIIKTITEKHIRTKLLIIDNEEKIRKIVRIYLKNKNFEIIEAENGAMGLRMFLSCKPDLVITDLSLLDMDGKEVIKLICELGNVPIIASSVRGDDQEIIDTLNAGAYDYVIKPFNPELLLARINTNLRRSVVNQQSTVGEFLINGKIKINLLKHEVIIDDKIIFFPPKQYEFAKIFNDEQRQSLDS